MMIPLLSQSRSVGHDDTTTVTIRLVGHRGSVGPAHVQRLVAPPAEGEAHLHQGARRHHHDHKGGRGCGCYDCGDGHKMINISELEDSD